MGEESNITNRIEVEISLFVESSDLSIFLLVGHWGMYMVLCDTIFPLSLPLKWETLYK